MPHEDLALLSHLIRSKKDELLGDWRAHAQQLPGAKGLSALTLDDHIPDVVDDLAAALVEHDDRPIDGQQMIDSPPVHGLQRLRDGFDIVEVVAEYNMVRRAVHDLAARHAIRLQREAAHIVNRVIDEAIGLAVQSFAIQQAVEIQRRREEHLSFVAHDLQTPLTAISIVTTELKETLEAQADESVKELFESLERNVERLDSLVTKVVLEKVSLDQVASLNPEKRWFDLRPVVEKLARNMRPIFSQRGIQVTNGIPKKLAVFADAHMLTEVFQNLLANAAKYTENGEIMILAEQMDGSIECSVEDNGEGIPPERIDRVFDKLETDPDPLKQGLGLGLAIVKQAIEAHQGSIAVESTLGKGATFRFTIPIPDGGSS